MNEKHDQSQDEVYLNMSEDLSKLLMETCNKFNKDEKFKEIPINVMMGIVNTSMTTLIPALIASSNANEKSRLALFKHIMQSSEEGLKYIIKMESLFCNDKKH